MKTNPTERSILLTLLYSAIFEYPLTLEEITFRQIKTSINSFSQSQIRYSLDNLTRVVRVGKYWSLDLPRAKEMVEQRLQREVWSKKRWLEVDEVIKTLHQIPTISEVYITGSLAVNNIRSPFDDIDILIVTHNNRLWLSRFIVIFLTMLKGKYRLHDTEGRDSWCFNLWMDRSNIQLSKKRQNLYSSFEIIQAKQVIGERNSLLGENSWVVNYLPIVKIPDKSRLTKNERKSVRNICLSVINYFAFLLQRGYMAGRLTRESVKLHSAFFHPRNTQLFVRRKFAHLRQQYKV